MTVGIPGRAAGIDHFCCGLHSPSSKNLMQPENKCGIVFYKCWFAGEKMDRMAVKILKPGAQLPARGTAGSVGFDISACLDEEIVIEPGETRMVGSGVAVALEPGYAAFIYARSGLGIKNGIVPANCVGVVDSDYRGEIIVGLRNNSYESFHIRDGDRIAQMVIARCELPELVVCGELNGTTRGSNGFWSTGRD